MSMYELDHDELSTVLAALRFYEDKGLGEPYNRPEWIHEIATDGGAVMASLDGDAIDALCERLNAAEGRGASAGVVDPTRVRIAKLDDAREAVAELGAAAEFAADLLHEYGAPTRPQRQEIIARLRAAVRNVRGRGE